MMNKFILHDLVSGGAWTSESMGEIKDIMSAKIDMGAECDDFRVFKAAPLDIIDLENGEFVIGEYNIGEAVST